MITNIVAIGGGSMAAGETFLIDKEIVRLAGKKNPAALFIPTARSDDAEYCEAFSKVYGEQLGCKTDLLLLIKKPPSLQQIKKKIDAADIIYVGGGNTLMMMRRWRFLGVDQLLIKAWKKGKVMAGSSAGAICWFNYGHSDSMFYYHPEKWNWIRVRCLGILPFTACPHCLKEGRMQHFENMIGTRGGTGIALDDRTALHVKGDQFRILRSREDARAFRVFKSGKLVQREEFIAPDNFKPLKSLLETL